MLKATLQQDMKAALKAGDKPKLAALRFALSKMRECEDDQAVMVELKKLIKSHQDAFEQFSKADRFDLAQSEQDSLQVLQAYLPEALSEEALDQVIDQAIAATGASSPRDMGGVMKHVQAEVGMQADMKQVSQKVKERLSAKNA